MLRNWGLSRRRWPEKSMCAHGHLSVCVLGGAGTRLKEWTWQAKDRLGLSTWQEVSSNWSWRWGRGSCYEWVNRAAGCWLPTCQDVSILGRDTSIEVGSCDKWPLGVWLDFIIPWSLGNSSIFATIVKYNFQWISQGSFTSHILAGTLMVVWMDWSLSCKCGSVTDLTPP